MCDVKDLQNFVEEHWDGDFDIEVECKEMPTKIAIFSVDYCENYWTYDPPRWHFSGWRLFVFPDVRFHPQYKGLVERFEKYGIEDGSIVDLEAAKEIVNAMFGSKRTDYEKIKEVLEEAQDRYDASR